MKSIRSLLVVFILSGIFISPVKSQSLVEGVNSITKLIEYLSSGIEKVVTKEKYNRLLRELDYLNTSVYQLSRSKQELLIELKAYNPDSLYNLEIAVDELSRSINDVSNKLKSTSSLLLNQENGNKLAKQINKLVYLKRQNVKNAIYGWYQNNDISDLDIIIVETENVLSQTYDLMESISQFRMNLIKDPNSYIY